MDILQTRADVSQLQAETMRVFSEIQKTERQQRWLTPLLTVSAALAIASGFAAIGVQAAKLFAH